MSNQENKEPTYDHIMRALTMMLKRAADNGEVCMVAFYYRDPKAVSEESPMGACEWNVLSNNHVQFDRFMFDSFMMHSMANMDTRDMIKNFDNRFP